MTGRPPRIPPNEPAGTLQDPAAAIWGPSRDPAAVPDGGVRGGAVSGSPRMNLGIPERQLVVEAGAEARLELAQAAGGQAGGRAVEQPRAPGGQLGEARVGV